MVVQHNMQAVNANRVLNATTINQQKSTEKLSSGYKINRAGDDAAGLAISEKMRKQIKGLDRASTNAQDGISAVQTAEGALGEVQSMLQRMNELAVQSANGTNSVSDRTAIQNEIDQLTTEIDRVSETTKFNETYLLKGDKSVTKQVRFQYGNYNGTNSSGAAANTTIAAGVNFGMSTSTGANVNVPSTLAGIGFSSSVTAGVNTVSNFGWDTTTMLGVQVTFNPTAINSAVSALGGTAPFPSSSTGVTGSTVEGGGAHQDDQNALAKAIRDSGLSVTQTNQWDATAPGGGQNITSYKLELTGDAAQKYDVVALTTGGSNASTCGVFTIQTKGGEVVALITVGGGNAPLATSTSQVNTTSSVISASDASAARTTGHGESAQYFDRDGNRISNNALSRYFSASSGQSVATVQVRGDAPQVYDAVGNLTSLKAGNVNMIRDLRGPLNVSLHVGADATTENKITLNIDCMSAKNLGINGLRMDGSDSKNADLAIETIKEALQKVSDQRAELGAVQNRLEHTIENLNSVVENTEASESRIRDTDMAEEMVNYSKLNILAQAGQSMLAQANQSNQGVLSLLQ